MEDELNTLLQTKENLAADIMSFHLQEMILKEFELPQEQMLTEATTEKEIAESEEILSEFKAVRDQSVPKIEATNQTMLEALDRLNASMHDLSQKIAMLEAKYAAVEKDCQESDSLGNNNLTQSTNRRAKETILLMLENAKEEREQIEKRLSFLKSLHQLAENTATCVQSDDDCQLTLTRLRQKLSGLEFFSGLKCIILDDVTVAIHFIEPNSLSLPDDAKLVITLCFTPDESECLELSAVKTNTTIPEVVAVAASYKNDKDLPKLIRRLRKAWLSYVMLAAEISSLREGHAIDWKPDTRVFHLIIANYICRLAIPPSYPSDGGRVTLEQIMGGPSNLTSVTEENPLKDVSLTGWVNHLETILA